MRRIGPGRVRWKLAEMLATKLNEAGHTVRTDPEKLWPNQGFWRCQVVKADVMPWIGQFEIYRHEKWMTAGIGSWATMGECIRGFDFEEVSFLDFELYPHHELPPRDRFKHSTMSL